MKNGRSNSTNSPWSDSRRCRPLSGRCLRRGLAELHERRGDTERALEFFPQRNERPTKRQTDPLPLATLLALS